VSRRVKAKRTHVDARLSELKIRKAVEALDWPSLEKHLRALRPRDIDVESLGRIILRCSSLVLRYPNSTRQRRRDVFFENLAGFIVARVGPAAGENLRAMFSVIILAEGGYRSLLELLERTAAAKCPASERVAAILSLGAHQVSWMLKTISAQARAAEVFEGASLALRDADGALSDGDDVVDMLNATTSAALIMYAVQEGWISADDAVILPPLPQIGESERTQAREVQQLTEAWAFWQALEERRRYDGGRLERLAVPTENSGPPIDVLRYGPPADAVGWEKVTVANYERPRLFDKRWCVRTRPDRRYHVAQIQPRAGIPVRMHPVAAAVVDCLGGACQRPCLRADRPRQAAGHRQDRRHNPHRQKRQPIRRFQGRRPEPTLYRGQRVQR
jgi:hypothetical protein